MCGGGGWVYLLLLRTLTTLFSVLTVPLLSAAPVTSNLLAFQRFCAHSCLLLEG